MIINLLLLSSWYVIIKGMYNAFKVLEESSSSSSLELSAEKEIFFSKIFYLF